MRLCAVPGSCADAAGWTAVSSALRSVEVAAKEHTRLGGELEMKEHALALLMPLHTGAQHCERGQVGDRHDRLLPAETAIHGPGRQNLPPSWLMKR